METAENLPKSIKDGRTPEAWCEILMQRHGVKLSPRNLRKLARETGQMTAFGKDMLLLPTHVDKLSEEMTCRLNSSREGKSIGSGDGSKSFRTANTTDKVRAKLLSQVRKP